MIRSTALIAAALMATTAAAADKAPQDVAKLSAQEGTVLVNQGEQFVTASASQMLAAGDRVLVMEGGSAKITFNDGCAMSLASGSMVAIPAKSTCAGAVASVESIGPSYAQAVGAEEDDDPDTAVVTFWMGAAIIAIIATAGGDKDSPDTFVPVSP